MMSSSTSSCRVHAGVKGAAPQSIFLTNDEDDSILVSMCDGGGKMIFQRKVDIPEPIARDISPESSKPADGDERAGDAKVKENSEKEEMQGGSIE